MLTIDSIRELVGNSIFTVKFIKRKDHSVREMNCRLNVKKYLTGGEQPYDPRKYDLLNVFDLQIGEYRSIPLEGIVEIRTHGQTLSA